MGTDTYLIFIRREGPGKMGQIPIFEEIKIGISPHFPLFSFGEIGISPYFPFGISPHLPENAPWFFMGMSVNLHRISYC
jgi:hypothetical protein